MEPCRPFKKVRSTDATDSSFAAKIITATEPSGEGVLTLAPLGVGIVPCKLRIIAWGTGDANDAFDMKIIAWDRIGTGTSTLWIPQPIVVISCTMGTATGVGSQSIASTDLICDTMAISKEPVSVADVTPYGYVKIYSPADDTLAWADMEVYECEKLEFLFDTTTGNPTGVNAAVKFIG